ncbi:hypothetical protein [Streptomyces sp. NPDC046985]|uniref:type II toxin-antitoxin system RelE family toxin n=1 Tax=Streptomyces sp. NPDC046985 TaxID=3155377 RepID=UPI003400D889
MTQPLPTQSMRVPQSERLHRHLRVGYYRVVSTIDEGGVAVWIASVGHRSTVYEDLTHL